VNAYNEGGKSEKHEVNRERLVENNNDSVQRFVLLHCDGFIGDVRRSFTANFLVRTSIRLLVKKRESFGGKFEFASFGGNSLFLFATRFTIFGH
jgi:hypothetical protein